jgi:hypothetical protein
MKARSTTIEQLWGRPVYRSAFDPDLAIIMVLEPKDVPVIRKDASEDLAKVKIGGSNINPCPYRCMLSCGSG